MSEHPEDLYVDTARWTRTIKVSISGRFTLNSVAMIRRLGILDMGIIMMLEEIVTDDLAGGRLHRVLPQWHGTPVPVYAVTETRLLPAKTQCFIEFLREHLPQGLKRC